MTVRRYVRDDLRALVGSVEITKVTGAIHFETKADGSYFIIAPQDQLLVIEASNGGPAGTWTMPIQGPTHVVNATVSKVDGESFMSIKLRPQIAGDWALTEKLINSGLEGVRLSFPGLVMQVVLPSS